MGIVELGTALFSTAPITAPMRGDIGYRNWGKDLADAAAAKSLAPLRDVLVAIIDDALRTLAPQNAFLATRAAQLDVKVYEAASAEVLRLVEAGKTPAAFVLGLLVLLGWAARLGDELYRQGSGFPREGWDCIPYACAFAGMKAGALEAAGATVQHAYDVWVAARDQWSEQVHAILRRYRELASEIADRLEPAVANLASALRRSCEPSGPHLRAEVGALVWSLGMVPESQVFCEAGHTLPCERFFQDVVRQSLAALPTDPLVQYVWLAMKDRPPLNLRDHRSLFTKINLVYSVAPVVDGLVSQASAVFARALIGWFRGDLRPEQAEGYLAACEAIEPITSMTGWLVVLRLFAFREVVRERFTPSASGGGAAAGGTEAWYALADIVRQASGQAGQFRIQAPVDRRNELPFARLIEEELSQANAAGGPARVDRVLAEVERTRSALLSHWLTLTPPLPTPDEGQAMQALLAEQERLVDRIHGAYFLILFAMMPWHFRRYQMSMDDILAESPAEIQERFDPAVGLQTYGELRAQLDALIAKMSEAAPGFANSYRHPEATVATLIRMIGSHAQR
jgi:hypothetical protein